MASDSYFLDLNARKEKEILPGLRTKTFWRDQMLISLVDLDPGAVSPTHTHVEEQVGYVAKGTVDMEIAGTKRTMKEGEMYHIPANVPHGAHAGKEGATVLDVFSPVRTVLKY
ncbi:MAG TPA: cupin domain-containing protein [Candidatus Thermoplasmatota archaeon]|nr:cupin domain-containing protein [Candidatus Thermoplasmatota archaeon]